MCAVAFDSAMLYRHAESVYRRGMGDWQLERKRRRLASCIG